MFKTGHETDPRQLHTLAPFWPWNWSVLLTVTWTRKVSVLLTGEEVHTHWDHWLMLGKAQNVIDTYVQLRRSVVSKP